MGIDEGGPLPSEDVHFADTEPGRFDEGADIAIEMAAAGDPLL
ncbi:hypothetical protein AB0H60_14475 [Nocardia rhamnosiphila]|nr:hypothetical protein [Nocardia zapadnayensis]